MNISEQYYENCKKKSEFKDIKNERFDKWRGSKRESNGSKWSWPVLVRPAGGRYE